MSGRRAGGGPDDRAAPGRSGGPSAGLAGMPLRRRAAVRVKF